METQSNPNDASVVGWPLTFRELSNTASICARITASLMFALNRFHERHPLLVQGEMEGEKEAVGLSLHQKPPQKESDGRFSAYCGRFLTVAV
jgi:hypothetical protein